jgi:hypothetical protein
VGAGGVGELADDLACVVDAGCNRIRTRGIVEGEIGAADQQEAVGAMGVGVPPDDLPEVIDAECLGVAGG